MATSLNPPASLTDSTDTPLSIASAIVSFLTFAYAIGFGVFIYTQRGQEAPERPRKLSHAFSQAVNDLRRLHGIVHDARSVLGNKLEKTTLMEQINDAMNECATHARALMDLRRQVRLEGNTSRWSALRTSTLYSLLANRMEAEMRELLVAEQKLRALAGEVESRLTSSSSYRWSWNKAAHGSI